MTLKKRFRIIDGPLSVRAEPRLSAVRRGELAIGGELDVDASTRREADGFIWWQHAAGWSAERRLDNRFVFLQEIATPTPTPQAPDTPSATRTFKVVDGPVSIRAEPTRSAMRLGEIPNGGLLQVRSDSRREAEGYIWWQHALGWSAERTVDGSYVIMQETTETPTVPDESGTRPPLPTPPPPTEPPTTPRYFRVSAPLVNVRANPSAAGAKLGEMKKGDEISTRLGDRTEANGFVWWRHTAGWSVEKRIDDSEVYMERINALTPPLPTIGQDGRTVTLPDGKTFVAQEFVKRSLMDVASIQWVQYFGNSQFAQRIWAEGKQWYKYSQGLHGGFDYGSSRFGTPLYAGVDGQVLNVFRNAATYTPNYVQVTVGPYLLIYGHLTNVPDLQKGQWITPDTIVGYVDAGGQNHLHFEVRYQSWWIVNPLLVMTPDARDPLLSRYSDYASHFYRDATWSQWVDPFDQPVLRLSGPLIGPHSRR